MPTPTNPLSSGKFLLIAITAFAVVFGSVWLWIAKEPFAYQDYDFSIWNTKLKLVKDGRIGSVTIIGDSNPCAALLPNRLGAGVVNLGLPTGSPIELYFLTRKILANPGPPKAVILSILPSNFMGSEHFWDVAVNYGLFDFNELEEARRQARALRDTSLFGTGSPGDIDARLKSFLYTINFPSYYFPAFVHAHGFGRYRYNIDRLKLLFAERGHSYFGTDNGSIEPDKEAALKSFVPTKILDYYFDQTLALLQSRRIPVYFIAMPHNEASVRLYYPGLKSDFTAYLNQYAHRYPNFHILGDTLPVYPSDCFGDPWHLNEKGAVPWSDHVAQLLNESQVEGGPFGLELSDRTFRGEILV